MYLDDLRDLGVTAIEVMPVGQFPGRRNWGYDGVFPYAVQDSYGGPDGFRRLIEACHALGLAVVLDVVYNHLGPEGNHLGEFGPFTDRYRAPWGPAINFDGQRSDEVRHRVLWELYRELLRLRRDRPSLASLSKAEVAAWPDERAGVLPVLRGSDAEEALILFHFGEGAAEVHVPFAGAPWRRVLDSAAPRWGGPGSLAPEEVAGEAESPVALRPDSFALFVRSRAGPE